MERSNSLRAVFGIAGAAGIGQPFLSASFGEENPASPAISQLWQKYAALGNVSGAERLFNPANECPPPGVEKAPTEIVERFEALLRGRCCRWVTFATVAQIFLSTKKFTDTVSFLQKIG